MTNDERYSRRDASRTFPKAEPDPEEVARIRASQHWGSKPLTEADFDALFVSGEERDAFERKMLAHPPTMSGEEALAPCAVVVREGGVATGGYWAFAAQMRLYELPDTEEEELRRMDLPDGDDE